ncbi:hypothetical protein [Haliangium ochraceum]|uniref:Lipoprotein n=1 Tax=Haliangium ochraceum (strain DSM 14365 / JCM 11303 / SMP-2) TaxID=502025 RepID=D0LNS7_HALO1|nr:hypothetical protein [Haliangium ochraceum]ACY16982.1 hypothetical protein Hoch_4489 [Haliangium ochraceum DSM 14365]
MFRTRELLATIAIALLVVGCSMQPSSDTSEVATTSAAIENGEEGYCNTDALCSAGEGDCDGSDECVDGLRCLFNVGADYGFDPGTDVCDCPLDEDNGGGSFCSDLCPCESGQGDCDDDSECETGLLCYRDIGASYGLDDGDDVCAVCPPADANGSVDFCNAGCACEEGEGDCDSDSDCATGLSCYLNVGADFGLDADTDVCAECPPDSMLGHVDFCSPDCQCSQGEGDCDTNADCADGLRCFLNVGTDFGYSDPDMDVCAECPPPSLNGRYDFCTPDCPCAEGFGDCDSDADCQEGLTCASDIGANYGLDPDDDVCIQL